MIKNAHAVSRRRIGRSDLGGIPEALSERRRAGLRRKPEAVTGSMPSSPISRCSNLVDFKLYEDRQNLR